MSESEWRAKSLACERHCASLESEITEVRGMLALSRDEVVKLRRDLDRKDHEVASLRSDLNAAPRGEAMIAILNQPPRHVCECGCAAALRQRVEELEEMGRIEHSACEAAMTKMEQAVEVMKVQQERAVDAEAEVEKLERDRGMLKAVHGALVDAGCRMGEIGHCEADLVREVTKRAEAAEADVERVQGKRLECIREERELRDAHWRPIVDRLNAEVERLRATLNLDACDARTRAKKAEAEVERLRDDAVLLESLQVATERERDKRDRQWREAFDQAFALRAEVERLRADIEGWRDVWSIVVRAARAALRGGGE